MAKPLNVIQMDYTRSRQQADELDRLAREIRSIADNQLAGALSGINNAWKSDTAPAYIKKGRSVQDQLRTRARELERAASTVRQIAENTYHGELYAYQQAMARQYR